MLPFFEKTIIFGRKKSFILSFQSGAGRHACGACINHLITAIRIEITDTRIDERLDGGREGGIYQIARPFPAQAIVLPPGREPAHTRERGILVARCRTASLPTSACFRDARSKRSAGTDSAPRRLKTSMLCRERLNARTWCPLVTSRGTTSLPKTPVAPVTKMFMLHTSFVAAIHTVRREAHLAHREKWSIPPGLSINL